MSLYRALTVSLWALSHFQRNFPLSLLTNHALLNVEPGQRWTPGGIPEGTYSPVLSLTSVIQSSFLTDFPPNRRGNLTLSERKVRRWIVATTSFVRRSVMLVMFASLSTVDTLNRGFLFTRSRVFNGDAGFSSTSSRVGSGLVRVICESVRKSIAGMLGWEDNVINPL